MGPSLSTIYLHFYLCVFAPISSWCMSKKFITLEHSNIQVYPNQNLKNSIKNKSTIYSNSTFLYQLNMLCILHHYRILKHHTCIIYVLR